MGGEGKSVLFGGCRLAGELHSLVENKSEFESEAMWDYEDIWEMVKIVWVEMLVSAAYHCDWKEHARQLGQGGELLTHVALLMAHLGFSKHIRMMELPPELAQLQDYYPHWDWENLNQLVYYLA